MLSLLVLFDNNNKHPFDKSLQFYFHVHLIAFLISGWASIDSFGFLDHTCSTLLSALGVAT